MPLIAEQLGSGPELVFLHGWGLNSAVWKNFVAGLSHEYRITLIDLPGFGVNNQILPDNYNLDAITTMIGEVLPSASVLIGWSLGGLVAQKLAIEYPDRVQRLICVATTPKFKAEINWPGIKPEVLKAFASQLHSDVNATVNRFLAIQAMGSPRAKADILALKSLLDERPAAAAAALSGGLEILRQADIRSQLPAIQCPTLRIYGKKDSLVPVAVTEEVERLQPASVSMLFPGASHAPFISHANEFETAIRDYLTN
ncbi:pimeloyl-ACP methyl ester esterase BioH [Lacimicrobium alkaliphilum]|uniref:Pimeloyl-[acyl-carrier protein] methyl ester esterase n=1 Tax=Lacimicrobium alkaliphilum TaxID=1526571 RepID=A0ABQ1RRL2_9ALTE|nr:pimeloyl-ACP methyl ester esterase BioH [Lacimicrobium alkaliphilum]GGD77116.1 pimeloyl-[acyl-carrier protein] methyl ester esterase [Lacimicrobium alkaliphilum]